MYSKFCAITVLALSIFGGVSDAQECVPRSVQGLKVDASHILSWALSPNEECDVTEFLVQIWQIGYPQEYTFTVTETKVDVSFLEVCEEWTFNVIPISGFTAGSGRRIITFLPLPAGANITIAYLNATHNSTTDDVHLHWDLADRRYGNCSLLYRVTVEKDGSPTIEDLYVSETSLDLHFLSPCTEYQFTVRAIHVGHPNQEGPARIAFHTMPAVRQGGPTLIDIENGANKANTTWRLQSYARNPCRVSEFRLDDQNGTFHLYIPYQDSRLRSTVNVTLDSLEPSKLYTLEASVRNTAGWSKASVVIFETLAAPEDKGSS